MNEWSRREILQRTTLLAGAAVVAELTTGWSARAQESLVQKRPTHDNGPGVLMVPLEEVSGQAPVELTWGTPWARGQLRADQPLKLQSNGGKDIAGQVWPLAYWPDGSIKWSAHAAVVRPDELPLRVVPGGPTTGSGQVKVTEQPDVVLVDTGLIRCDLARQGPVLIRSIVRQGQTILKNGRLVAMKQDSPGDDPETLIRREHFFSEIKQVTVEQTGPIRAVIRWEGRHRSEEGREWLPFIVRAYFYSGSDQVRWVHTFIYDGDEHKDYLCGLGVRFDVPMTDPAYDRHVRFVGEGHGLFAEAVQGITGLRRDPGQAVRTAQVEGRATPPLDQWDRQVSGRLGLIPQWGDYTLSQLCADGFQIRKRTKSGHAWISAATGRRSGGVGYIGGARGGGVVFGMRDFWQKHPTQLDIRQAHTDQAEVTIWLWSPSAPAMDLRFYHDGMGMDDSYQKQLDGLEITYEDYEPGYGTPHGIARTTELYFKVVSSTPSRMELVEFADRVRKPTQLVCRPERYLDAGVFGAIWSLPDRSTRLRVFLEDRLSFVLDQYIREVDQRSWYGFWDYGDVMHSYDTDRHVWRYDVGGYAWDNSELSTDIWLWISFLRTGRADVFRMAEAMTRHTGEVDVYHLGRFRGLGSRHNVQHWGCSAKQARISTAMNRRYYYFLTADERVGDLLREQLSTPETEQKVPAGRKLAENAPVLPLPPVQNPPIGDEIPLGAMGFGNIMSAWVTEAERTNDPSWHEKVVNAMKGMALIRNGFFAGGRLNLKTGQIRPDDKDNFSISHLANCFGLPEIVVEMIRTYGDQAPGFAEKWVQYGRLYTASREERAQETGFDVKTGNLVDSHSRNTAYAASYLKDPRLARRAWNELLGKPPEGGRKPMKTERLTGPTVLNPIDAVPLGSNGSQWQLAVIQCLAYIGDSIPNE
ncbi:MAG: hypothetical protein KatS3mg104_2545 [Phycisphaerae bacterium]|jgi:hypothetical protein|nr:MAG: hypothetical protein KatS3mg104_2545 [Phycisphaerae bacterium]